MSGPGVPQERPRSAEAEALCLSCALCCDGTLFSSVPLGPGERLSFATGAVLRQPCPALAGTRCTAYGERPSACRGFQCLLLIALADGEVTLDGAKQLAAEAKREVAALGAPLGRLRALAKAAQLEEGQAEALRRVEATLRRHFLGHRSA